MASAKWLWLVLYVISSLAVISSLSALPRVLGLLKWLPFYSKRERKLSGQAVMAIGGFNGGDPAPTLAEFQALVQAGDVHYSIVGGQDGGPGGGHPPPSGVGGATVYDLTATG